jgi:hypothetical protein
MSKSYKKIKVRSTTSAESEKENKQEANRKLRRITNQKVKIGDEVLPEIKDVSNVWSFNKDGKRYDKNMTEKELRK